MCGIESERCVCSREIVCGQGYSMVLTSGAWACELSSGMCATSLL